MLGPQLDGGSATCVRHCGGERPRRVGVQTAGAADSDVGGGVWASSGLFTAQSSCSVSGSGWTPGSSLGLLVANLLITFLVPGISWTAHPGRSRERSAAGLGVCLPSAEGGQGEQAVAARALARRGHRGLPGAAGRRDSGGTDRVAGVRRGPPAGVRLCDGVACYAGCAAGKSVWWRWNQPVDNSVDNLVNKLWIKLTISLLSWENSATYVLWTINASVWRRSAP